MNECQLTPTPVGVLTYDNSPDVRRSLTLLLLAATAAPIHGDVSLYINLWDLNISEFAGTPIQAAAYLLDTLAPIVLALTALVGYVRRQYGIVRAGCVLAMLFTGTTFGVYTFRNLTKMPLDQWAVTFAQLMKVLPGNLIELACKVALPAVALWLLRGSPGRHGTPVFTDSPAAT